MIEWCLRLEMIQMEENISTSGIPVITPVKRTCCIWFLQNILIYSLNILPPAITS